MKFRTLFIPLCLFACILIVDRNGSTLRAQASQAIPATGAAAYNLHIATDASPDLTDLDSFIRSTTSQWTTPEQKVWALFYWSHILKRQTSPIVLHGFEVTDPIRNFNDYGFTMCSTITGINQTLYEKLGLQHQYWDVCNHTVAQVYYNDRWHLVDSSMSNLVTLDDGVTLASLQEAAANGARLTKERSLYATSPNGFLTGSDSMRSLANTVSPLDGSTMSGFASAYCDTGLKYRDYYYNWTSGHRYVLNVRENESYTRYYRRLGEGKSYYVSSEKVANADPADTFENDSSNRFGLRGNGRWTFTPSLGAGAWETQAYVASNVNAAAAGGLMPIMAGQPGDVIYKVQAANAITSQQIRALFDRVDPAATAALAVSVNGGATWVAVGNLDATVGNGVPLVVDLRDQVNAQYETLLRVQMMSPVVGGITLTGFTVDTITQVNTKALPRLNVGRNEVYIGADAQSDTMTLWPDLRADRWKNDVFAASNIASQSVTVPRKYTAVVYPSALKEDAHLTYRMQAPTEFTKVTYGGRLHNYRAGSYIDFLHSFDNGATWIRSYRLTDISKPYDVVHYETVDVPAGVNTVLFRYLIHNTNPDVTRASGLYDVRMEGSYRPQATTTPAVDVTLRWNEIKADRTTVARSHKQRVTQFPTKYVVNVGGSDHPVMESMTVSLAGLDAAAPGYNDGIDAGGSKYVYRQRTEGTNLAAGKSYTVSRAPSGFQSSAKAANTTILTDGVVGAPMTGSYAYWWGQCWTSGTNVDLRVDLGAVSTFGAVRAHLFGYTGWDALKGQVKDRVEVFTSVDGATWISQGLLDLSLWKKDIPINHMLQDDEKATGWNFELLLPSPVAARYVKYQMTPKRDLCASELQVMDRVTYTPFDLRIALPDAPPVVEPVGRPDPPPNGAPAVTLTAPVSQSYDAPATVTLAANASDADGSVARVEFFVNGTLVAQDTAAPYAASWTTQSPGTYTVVARAVDNLGMAATSSAGTFSVQEAVVLPGDEIVLWAAEANAKPGWTVTPDVTAAGGSRLQSVDAGAAKPVNAAAAPTKYFELTFDANAGQPYRLWIRGKALANSTANDSVFVQFDGSLDDSGAPNYRIGTADSLTYVIEECSSCGISNWGWEDTGWGSVGLLGPTVQFAASGPQRMRIQVREDGLGVDQIVLSSRSYLVNRPGLQRNDGTILPKTVSQQAASAPTVSIASPQVGASVGAASMVTVEANAQDASGTVSKVEFFVNGAAIGTATAMPFNAGWNVPATGTYVLTARATNASGTTTTSAPVSVTATTSQGNDDVVLYAAEASTVVNWTRVADASAAGGARLQNPNLAASKQLKASATPGSYFEMTFEAVAGRPYRLWMRGKATSNAYTNDSVFVQFDGSVDAAGTPIWRSGTTSATELNLEECSNCGVAGWGWEDNGWGGPNVLGPVVFFERDGLQTIRIQPREDGLGIDQLVISSGRWLTTSPGAAKNDTTVLPR